MNNKNSSSVHRRFLGESAMLVVTLLWGATFVIVKESLNSSSTMLFIFLRFTIAALIFIPFLFYKKVKLGKKAVATGFFLGTLLFLGFATQTVGLKYTLATKSGFITGSAVVMIPIFQTLLEKKMPTRGSILGAVIVFIGILFLSSGGNSIFSFLNDLGKNFNFGDFMTLICAVFFALYVVYLDIVSGKYEFMPLLFMQLTTTAFFGLVFSFIFSASGYEKIFIEFNSYLIFGLFYTSIFATLITTALLTKFQKLISPTKAGIIFSLEPLFAAVFAFFLLSEKITNFGIIGGILIFGGLLVSELYDNLTLKNV